MRIKGIISNEITRNDSEVYMTLTPISIMPVIADTFSATLQEDIEMVNIVTNKMNENPGFTFFAAMPSMAVALGDTVDIIAEVKEQHGDYFVMTNYTCIDITHTPLFYERTMNKYWEVIKEAAIN